LSLFPSEIDAELLWIFPGFPPAMSTLVEVPKPNLGASFFWIRSTVLGWYLPGPGTRA
jgi:hypothetical protein